MSRWIIFKEEDDDCGLGAAFGCVLKGIAFAAGLAFLCFLGFFAFAIPEKVLDSFNMGGTVWAYSLLTFILHFLITLPLNFIFSTKKAKDDGSASTGSILDFVFTIIVGVVSWFLYRVMDMREVEGGKVIAYYISNKGWPSIFILVALVLACVLSAQIVKMHRS